MNVPILDVQRLQAANVDEEWIHFAQPSLEVTMLSPVPMYLLLRQQYLHFTHDPHGQIQRGEQGEDGGRRSERTYRFIIARENVQITSKRKSFHSLSPTIGQYDQTRADTIVLP